VTHDDWENASRAILAPLREPMAVPSSRAKDTGDVADRDVEVARVAEMIDALPSRRQRSRQRRRAASWSWAIAAVTVLGVGLAQLAGTEVPQEAQVDEGQHRATLMAGRLSTSTGRILRGGESFEGLGELITPEDQSALVLTDAGAQVTFAPKTRASLSRDAHVHRVDLRSGQVRLDVPPLPAGSQLVVSTSDALVTVVGTRFSVSHSGEDTHATTCVRVSEGRVSVRRDDGADELLGPGSSSGCDDAAVAPTPADDTGPAIEPRKPAAPRQPIRSTLANQNQLMRDGLAAEQAGQLGRARSKLRALVERYPSSPHVPEAKRALARVEQALRGQ